MLKQLLAIWLLAMNLIAFAAMGLDKRKAKNRRWRIPERTLFLFALLGGSFGGLAGMTFFHHKTKQKKFQIGFPVLFLLQAALLVWLEVCGLPLSGS